MQKKDYVVWYPGGSGGFIVSWLLQLAVNPSCIDLACKNFPNLLENIPTDWRNYESIPPNVGLLCNTLSSNLQYQPNVDNYSIDIIKILLNGNNSIYDLFYSRVKYYLTNHVYKSGHASPDQYNYFTTYPDEFLINDLEHFKKMTDVIFDTTRSIFVYAPLEYQALSQQLKKSANYALDVKTLLTPYPQLKTFDTLSIWNGSYRQELENILNRKLTTDQISACDILVNRYIQISPPEFKDCYNRIQKL
jgi:hypothetical protein